MLIAIVDLHSLIESVCLALSRQSSILLLFADVIKKVKVYAGMYLYTESRPPCRVFCLAKLNLILYYAWIRALPRMTGPAYASGSDMWCPGSPVWGPQQQIKLVGTSSTMLARTFSVASESWPLQISSLTGQSSTWFPISILQLMHCPSHEPSSLVEQGQALHGSAHGTRPDSTPSKVKDRDSY